MEQSVFMDNLLFYYLSIPFVVLSIWIVIKSTVEFYRILFKISLLKK